MNIQIQPEILQWVADYCNLSVYEMVNLLKPPYSKHQVLMSGQFTIEQIERLSSVTGVPFGYFFFLIPPVKSKIKKKAYRKILKAKLKTGFVINPVLWQEHLRKQRKQCNIPLLKSGVNPRDFINNF